MLRKCAWRWYWRLPLARGSREITCAELRDSFADASSPERARCSGRATVRPCRPRQIARAVDRCPSGDRCSPTTLDGGLLSRGLLLRKDPWYASFGLSSWRHRTTSEQAWGGLSSRRRWSVIFRGERGARSRCAFLRQTMNSSAGRPRTRWCAKSRFLRWSARRIGRSRWGSTKLETSSAAQDISTASVCED